MTLYDQADFIQPLPWLQPVHGSLRFWALRMTLGDLAVEWRSDSMISLPEFELAHESASLQSPRVRRSGRFEVTLRFDAAGVSEFSDAIAASNDAAAASLFIAADSQGSEEREIANGTLDEIKSAPDGVHLVFRCGWPSADRRVCRNGRSLAGVVVEKDTWLPQVFGECSYFAPPLFDMQSAALFADIDMDASSLTLAESVSWPPRGVVQLNDEVIAYATISEDGRTLGSLTVPLTRSTPRAQRHGSRVILLPTNPLRWCVADHAAEVVELRAGSASGALLSTAGAAIVDLAGSQSTVYTRAALPLAVSHQAILHEEHTARISKLWQKLPDSLALDPMDAFTVIAPQRGAVITAGRNLLTARFLEDSTQTAGRFDLLQEVFLSLEFSDTPFWGPDTRLRVTVTKNSAVVSAQFNREGGRFSVPIKGIGAQPATGATSVAQQRIRISFETIEADGVWSTADAAIDGEFASAATIATASPVSLTARFATIIPEVQRTVSAATLFARVRNSGGASLAARLEVHVPDKLSRHADAAIASGETIIVELGFSLPSNVGAADLLSTNTEFSIAFPEGGAVDVQELWLEVDADPLPARAFAASAGSIPVTATIELPFGYNRVELDIAPLLTEEDRWSFFSDAGGFPEVRIELISPPDIDLWSVYVRDVHWRRTAYLANSIQAQDRVWCRTRGRHCREDGTANPAEVVASLLTDPSFAALGEDAIDAPSIEVVAAECDRRVLSFAAVIQDGMLLGDLFERALAEAAIHLIRADEAWRAVATPIEPDLSVLPRLTTAEIMAPGPGAQWSARTAASESSVGTELLIGETASFLRYLAARSQPLSRDEVLPLDLRNLPLQVGAPMCIEDARDADEILCGEIARVAFSKGSFSASLRVLARVREQHRTDHSLVLRSVTRGAILFFWDNQVIAELLDSGDLRIGGVLREGARTPVVLVPIFVAIPSDSQLAITHTVDDIATNLCFAANGDALTTCFITESAAITEASPAPLAAERRASSLVLGGATGGLAALRITNGHMELRGRIITNWIF
ncbi:hypothetical protein BH09SUM1_BH09SUM1_07250 [soil metagenome]